MSRLLLVRHGELESSTANRLWGQTDLRLCEAGIRQSELLRDRLAVERIDLAYASTLIRAITTAEIIAAPHDLKVQTTPDINEMDFGKFEGHTFEEITQADPEAARLLMNWDIIPSFPGGEGLQDMDNRIKQFIAGLDLSNGKTILIVAHAGSLRMMIARLLGMQIKDWRKLRIDRGSLSIVHTYPGIVMLSLLNDMGHVEGKLP